MSRRVVGTGMSHLLTSEQMGGAVLTELTWEIIVYVLARLPGGLYLTRVKRNPRSRVKSRGWGVGADDRPLFPEIREKIATLGVTNHADPTLSRDWSLAHYGRPLLVAFTSVAV